MAMLDTKKALSKSDVRNLAALCFVWCFGIIALVAMSIMWHYPFDIITHPLLGVKVLSTIVVSVNIILRLLSLSSECRVEGMTKNILKCAMICFMSTIGFHCLAVLFGAPALQSSVETFHFALLLTSLAIVPVCFVLGVSLEKWATVFARGEPSMGLELVIHRTTLGTLLGAWLGAVPIPLDWDRPWQVWPVSCVLGAVFGFCVGLFLSGVYLPYQYRQLHKMKIT